MFKKIFSKIQQNIYEPILKLLLWLVEKVYRNPLIYPIAHPVYHILGDTYSSYNKHKVFRLSASLAYYAIFSLPALIIVIIGLVGFFLGEAAIHGEVYSSLVDTLGPDASKQIENAVINIGTPDTNWWATVLGISFLIFLATGVFHSLQDGLNDIFEVKEVPRKVRIIEVIINRVLSFSMILCIGALLILSIIFNTLLLEIGNFVVENEIWVEQKVPPFAKPYIGYFTDYFLLFINLGVSVFLIAFFFATLYKVLPAVKIRWKYIWLGAFFAAILFWFGQMVMGLYLSRTSVISAYGAAGSIIVILIWVSYSAQLIFLGAEFIIATSNYNDVELPPKKFAVLLLNTKRTKKIKKPKNRTDAFHDLSKKAPPSYFELRMINIMENDIFEDEIEEHQEEESSTKKSLGFAKEKNIDLRTNSKKEE